MPFVIYNSKAEGRTRQRGVTYAARRANWMPVEQSYGYLTNHPVEDRAALEIAVEGGIAALGVPMPVMNYCIFFTEQEIAEAIDELPAEWFETPETI